MIKLKKIVAVTLAAAMCMGLSMTAFAENAAPARTEESHFLDLDSPYLDPAQSNPNGYGVTITPNNGSGEASDDIQFVPIEEDSKAYKALNTEEEVLDILKDSGLTVDKDTQIIPIAAVNVAQLDAEGRNVLTFNLGSQNFTTNKSDKTKYHEGDTIYAMVETKEGSGEFVMVPGEVKKNGSVDFDINHEGVVILIKTLDKNGRIAVIKKDSNGNVVEPPVIIDPEDPNQPILPTPEQPGTSNTPANGQNANGAANANGAGNAWTSPKTGEF